MTSFDQQQPQFDSSPSIQGTAASAQKASASKGRVFLVTEVLKDLRTERLQSQEEMAHACSDGKFRVSIATIKRAETGRAVVYRVARELARYFGVPVRQIIKTPDKSGMQ
ncbi:MAG: helix-turn-helix domain-containing protein [Burkholderiaceae bacterium]|uniref:Helix-turn-helix protein n=1 Tax=Roseateles toxinivorans TaxID=270368 RepID=A0A4R6QPR3_9BURK|nr:helix-turn-helix transcriptional regulator [Roseateles toxinivorans]MBT9457175.1 helix-turn-helix domain-containing protein [Burkholderiaceae bacterium]MBT9500900.1 helix-turn-helix domain-containing protein [Burkholderiaceae bacterium]TDP72683.1 helix-turn-helix protein [Roseateles toxinivorans]